MVQFAQFGCFLGSVCQHSILQSGEEVEGGKYGGISGEVKLFEKKWFAPWHTRSATLITLEARVWTF